MNKPIVGNLVRIKSSYPNTQAAGKIALVIKTLGIECIVLPMGVDDPERRSWWFDRVHLEVLS